MQSFWKLTQDQPGEVVELSGFWPPHGLRVLRFERSSKSIIQKPLFGAPASISFASLRSLRFVVGPSTGRDLRLQLSLSYNEEGAPRTWSVFFRVARVDKSEEALDLIFRVAQVLGWPSYILYRRDEGGIDLELRPESDAPFRAAQDSHQAPTIEEKADYQPTQSLYELAKRDTQRPRFRGPSEPALFTPEKHRAVNHWDDKEIVLRMDPELHPLLLLLLLLVGGPLLVGLWLLFEVVQLLFFFMATFFAMLIPMLLIHTLVVALSDDSFGWFVFASVLIPAGFFLFYRLPPLLRFIGYGVGQCFSRECLFDLAAGTLTTRRARYFWTRWQLTSISAITLVQREEKLFHVYLAKEERDKKGDKRYEVRAKLGWVSLHLWSGKEEARPNRAESYSLAVALARALDVPFREE